MTTTCPHVVVISSSSQSSNHWKYEVFLSLGDDTRTTFIDHISIALCDAGINTFVDYQLRREENIQSELDGEFEGSRINLVIFSKRYAESGCYLSKPSKIMRCREDQEVKVVYPIFYDVHSSQNRVVVLEKHFRSMKRMTVRKRVVIKDGAVMQDEHEDTV
nr:putative disease resistance protein At4g11170 [Malus domestica]